MFRVSCCMVFVLLSLAATSTAKFYTVGGSAGWDVSADLVSWSVDKTFFVGDILCFGYSKYHSVSEVSKEGYTNCSTTNAILTGTDGNTTVKLTSTGSRYFISGIPLYCFGGMKLDMNVIEQQEVKTGPARAPAPAGGPQVSSFSTRISGTLRVAMSVVVGFISLLCYVFLIS
ncbi:Early nodulin-like protein [Zostera marina]|uniref:Early nodulin-like protein n=1 Tax=Zostera marina TaxID=29655 RepID=A0A0K9NJV6_ZOSMR|nr:Early nodulin-like protein [Zostera marina]